MKTKLKRFKQHFLSFPKYLMVHPFDGFDDFKRFKKGKLYVAITMIVLFMFLRIYAFQYESVIINPNNPQNLNSLELIFSAGLLIMLFAVGNWSVTTLMEGKGTFKEIFMVTGYALFPVVIIGFPSIFISNFLTMEELGFYHLMIGVSYFLAGWLLFMGILNIHEYGLGKTLVAFFATVVSMSVMMFFGLLFFDLIQQFIAFVSSIYQELSLRY